MRSADVLGKTSFSFGLLSTFDTLVSSMCCHSDVNKTRISVYMSDKSIFTSGKFLWHGLHSCTMCTTGLLPAMVLRCRGAICNLQYTDPLKILHYNVGGLNLLKCKITERRYIERKQRHSRKRTTAKML